MTCKSLRPFRWCILVLILFSIPGCQRKQSAVIAGASMAPTLVGRHMQSICGDCQFPFKTDGERVPKSGKLVCPNCGFRENTAAQSGIRISDVVDVIPVRYPGEINRWDIVAVQDPIEGRVLVKRVVGLPGETIVVHDGNVWVDGRLPDRDSRTRNQMLVPVFDSKYLPRFTSGTSERICGRVQKQCPSAWQRIENQFEYLPRPPLEKPLGIDWLDYHHWRCYLHRGNRDAGFYIDDSLGFNQTLSRDVNCVKELVFEVDLEFTIESSANHRFSLSVPFLGADAVCEFDLEAASVSLSIDERKIWRVGECSLLMPEAMPTFRRVVTVSNLDGQITIAVDGVAVTMVDQEGAGERQGGMKPIEQVANPGSVPFSLGVSNDCRFALRMKRFRVWRDIHYFVPRDDEAVTLGADEYYVLGDNPALSRDSRDIGGIDRSEIVGRVLQPWDE